MATKRDEYAVIFNPTRWLFKWEVWIHTDYMDEDPRFAETRRITRKAADFRSDEAAKGFVKYQEDIQDFKEKK